MTRTLTALFLLTVLAVGIALLAPSLAQPLAYHAFADRRTLLGIPNLLDVASNAAFLLAAIYGIAVTLASRTAFATASERWTFAVFFGALALTAIGSAWYHLDPGNERLFWDRLPMTVAFMSLVATQLGERLDPRVGAIALAPLLLVGMLTVVHWRTTERSGDGNIVPYVALQLWALGALTILAMRRSRYSHGAVIFAVIALYSVAKGFEVFDRAILDLGGVVSGHTLKHLVAATSGVVLAWTLARRRVVVALTAPEPAGRDVLAASRLP